MLISTPRPLARVPMLVICMNRSDVLALRAVPVIERDGQPSYVRLLDIPPPFQGEFRDALRGSACPVIDGKGEYAWASDWADWLEGRSTLVVAAVHASPWNTPGHLFR